MATKLILLCAIFGLIQAAHYDLPPAISAIVLDSVRTCLAQTSANVEDLRALNHGDFTKDAVENKKFLLCMGQDLGLLDNDGDLDLEKILSYEHPNWSKETVHAFYEKCKKHGKVTHEDHAFVMYQCFYESSEHIPLLPWDDL